MLQLRHSLVKDYPQLFAMRMVKMRAFEEQLIGLVTARLRHDEPTASGADIDNRARLITLVAFGVMRHAWSCWAKADPPVELADELLASFGQLKAMFPTASPA